MSWTTVKLADLATVSSGGGAPQDADAFGSEGTPFVRAGSLIKLLKGLPEDGLELLQPEVAAAHRLKLFPAGTVLFAKSGMSATKGHIYQLKNPAYVVNHLAALTPRSAIAGRYLRHVLQFKSPTGLIKDEAYPSIRLGEIEEMEVPAPRDDAEKERIAAILDQADDLRRKRQRALDRLNQLAQAIFHEIFGDPIKNSKGWDVAALGDLFTLKHGFAFKSENFVSEGPYILLTPGNFFEQGGFRHRGEKQKYHSSPVPEDYVLSKGDLLIAMTEQAQGLLGSPIIVPDDSKYLHNQRLGKVEKLVEIETVFVFEMMNTNSIRARIQKDSTGLKVKHTSPTKIANIKIGIPPIELQEEYVAIVERIQRQKHHLSTFLSKSDILFDSLQHRAFQGEL